MDRFIKIIFFISLLWMTFFVWSHMVFSGVFDKKYSSEALDENFRNHEKDFSDLVTRFNKSIILLPNNRFKIVILRHGIRRFKKLATQIA
jgi:uncharacterized membrane protein SpoIIM required for sporulation